MVVSRRLLAGCPVLGGRLPLTGVGQLVGIALLCGLMSLAGCVPPSTTRPADRREGGGERGRPEVVSLLGRPLYPVPPGEQRRALEAKLKEARDALAESPNDVDRMIWVARRLGYLRRMNEAVAVLDAAIAIAPEDPRLYRHRGHRYIGLRKFDLAIADLSRAAELIRGRPDEVEPDGMPNARGIPLTTTAFNVWYHLGVAKYLQGDFSGALAAFRETLKFGRGFDDNTVASTDWMCMCLQRLGRGTETKALLEAVYPEMDIIENHAYHRRVLLYKGLLRPEELLEERAASDVDRATLGYGVGNWYLARGDTENAIRIFRRVVQGENWAAFGFIAAEVDLARHAAADVRPPG